MLPGGEDGKRGRAENHLTGLSEGIPKDKLERRNNEYEHEGQERELAESGWRPRPEDKDPVIVEE
jgi:hypothetical protein